MNVDNSVPFLPSRIVPILPAILAPPLCECAAFLPWLWEKVTGNKKGYVEPLSPAGAPLAVADVVVHHRSIPVPLHLADQLRPGLSSSPVGGGSPADKHLWRKKSLRGLFSVVPTP